MFQQAHASSEVSLEDMKRQWWTQDETERQVYAPHQHADLVSNQLNIVQRWIEKAMENNCTNIRDVLTGAFFIYIHRESRRIATMKPDLSVAEQYCLLDIYWKEYLMKNGFDVYSKVTKGTINSIMKRFHSQRFARN